MNNNQKEFGIYVFLSTFSRNLIEVFIPVILYKFGFELREVIFYYLLANTISLIISYPMVAFSKRYNNKILSIVGIVAFVILQLLLNNMVHSIWYLFGIATAYAVYRRGYWISRRYYNLKVVKKEKITTTYSMISIANQVGVIIASYCGSLILDFVSLQVLNVIAIILFVMSIIPLYRLKFKHEKNNEKLDLIKNIKKIPKSNLYLFGSYELHNVVTFLFPLYIIIYVKDTYQAVGAVNLITNLALIVFTYLFGKQLDMTKKNFLVISILLAVAVYVLKANSVGYMLIIASFLQGITTKMHELSISKEFYTLSKKFEYNNYNLIYEVVQNLFRTVVVVILFGLYILEGDLKVMIYATLFFIFIGVFLKFKQMKIKDYKPEE